MLMRLLFPRNLLLGLLVAAACLVNADAQEPLLPPSPLSERAPEQGPPGNTLLWQISAERALGMGFPSVATDLYQRLLNSPATPAKIRNDLIVGLATALLDDGRIQEADAALQRYVGLPTPASRLRVGLVAAYQRRFDQARAEAAAIAVESLSAGDRSWYFFLQGMLADAGRDFNRSGALYQQAIDAAISEAQRARFTLAREQARLSLGDFSEPQANALRQNVESFQGRALYSAVSLYAVVLNGLGRSAEAIQLLQRHLVALPVVERATSDEWRLLIGLIAGADDGAGRIALGQLLASGTDRTKQRVALQLLARASRGGPARDDFRRRLDDLLGGPNTHPLLEELLVFRAQVALAEKNYARAEADANRLLELFPGSQLKAAALGVLTGVLWEQGRYRSAAAQATRARDALPAGETRAQLGVLIAEAYFRARDYRNAADAYGATLNEVPTGVEPGLLIFQRVYSEIEGGRLEEAQALLDQFARDPRLDATNRWQAEWNLTRALQAAGETAKAYARINQLMDTPGSADGLSPDLKARLAWLQAHLSLEAGDPARTLVLADALVNSLDGADAALKAHIASTAMLLQARANFTMVPPRTDAALERLRKLRADYPRTEAAVYSFIVQADDAARKDQLVEAQGLLRRLADEFRDSPYAPYALYQAAQYAERRGQAQYYQEAYNILESLITKYGNSENRDIIFYARLKQGNLLRRLNDYGAAQQIYELLVNEYSQHQDAFAAQLALADCHAAQQAADASHQESAATIYERLLDLQTAPPDLRAEAGFKYGLNLARRGNVNRAWEVWGRLITNFLVDDAKTAALGAKGRYWMSRSLLELGGLFEQQAKLEEAREAYELVLIKALPGGALAQERLSRLRGTAPVATKP